MCVAIIDSLCLSHPGSLDHVYLMRTLRLTTQWYIHLLVRSILYTCTSEQVQQQTHTAIE